MLVDFLNEFYQGFETGETDRGVGNQIQIHVAASASIRTGDTGSTSTDDEGCGRGRSIMYLATENRRKKNVLDIIYMALAIHKDKSMNNASQFT